MNAKPSTSKVFEVFRDDFSLTISLNRPEKKNALTLAMWTELAEIFASLTADLSLRSIILHGKGGCFSAGADIAEFNAIRSNSSMARKYELEVDRCLQSIASTPIPVIAAVEGACVGGGFAIAQACDFRVAKVSAYFSLSPARVGLVYNVTKCERLVNLVGLTHAKRILLTGKRFGCTEMLQIGFLDAAIEDDPLRGARALAEEFQGSAPLSTRGMKSILRSIETGNVAADRDALDQLVAIADDSHDHREAVNAFSERRTPVFRGY